MSQRVLDPSLYLTTPKVNSEKPSNQQMDTAENMRTVANF